MPSLRPFTPPLTRLFGFIAARCLALTASRKFFAAATIVTAGIFVSIH